MTNNPEMCRPSIKLEKRERLRLAIRVDDVGLAASDEDKVALGQAEFPSLLEREGG